MPEENTIENSEPENQSAEQLSDTDVIQQAHEEEVASLMEEIKLLEAAQPAQKLEISPGKDNTTADEAKELTLEAFDYDEEAFIDARLDQRVKAALSAHVKANEQQVTINKDAADLDALVAGYADAAAEYGVQNPDYVKTLETYGHKVHMAPHVVDALLYAEGDTGPRLEMALLKDPKQLKELNKSKPIKAALLIAKLLLGKKKPADKTTSTPDPFETSAGQVAQPKSKSARTLTKAELFHANQA